MARVSLLDLIREATDEDKAALRDALHAQPAAAPARKVLGPEELRALRARHEAATRRITEERAKLGQALQAAEAARDRAWVEMTRIGAALGSLDSEAGTELDNVRREAFEGRIPEVDEAAGSLRREAVELEPTTAPGSARFPGGPPELFSNREAVEARRRALYELADLVTLRAAQAAFATAEDAASFVTAERAKLPAVEGAGDVRRRVEAARRTAAA